MVVNNDGDHGSKQVTGTFVAPETGLYHVYADYFEQGGSAQMIISAGGPNREYTILDGDIVYQWKGVECVEEPVNECNIEAISNHVYAEQYNNDWQTALVACESGELDLYAKRWAQKAFDNCR